jgi:tRNA pseudouridine55 synthase
VKANLDRTLYPQPLIFNAFKPAGISSVDVVRHFKRNLPIGYGKIGHFGTLDPFASGVLLIGVAQATRFNEYIHDDLPKTYLAVGKLGHWTSTGDLTVPVEKMDTSEYFHKKISTFSKEFIENILRSKFVGEYLQSPHTFSAAKFEGRPLHKWAREGVIIKKEQVLRHVYDLEVVKYSFPYLSIRYKVSSGTYIRSLFSDCAEELGTLGVLVSLVRESIGPISTKSSLHKKDWPMDRCAGEQLKGFPVFEALPYPGWKLNETQGKQFLNGLQLNIDKEFKDGTLIWPEYDGKVLGLATFTESLLRPVVVFN